MSARKIIITAAAKQSIAAIISIKVIIAAAPKQRVVSITSG